MIKRKPAYFKRPHSVAVRGEEKITADMDYGEIPSHTQSMASSE